MSEKNKHSEESESFVPSDDEKEQSAKEKSVEELDLFDLRTETSSDQESKDSIAAIQSITEAKSILECLLFAATEPLSIANLSSILEGMDTKTLRGLLLELQIEYNRNSRGIQLIEIGGGYQLATRPEHAKWVKRLHRSRKAPALSPAALETLAIIGYKQPITRAEIEAIRGVDSGAIVRGLVEAGYVQVTGHKQVVGRPFLYGTTKFFLKVFGLKKISDLPSIEELRKVYKVE